MSFLVLYVIPSVLALYSDITLWNRSDVTTYTRLISYMNSLNEVCILVFRQVDIRNRLWNLLGCRVQPLMTDAPTRLGGQNAFTETNNRSNVRFIEVQWMEEKGTGLQTMKTRGENWPNTETALPFVIYNSLFGQARIHWHIFLANNRLVCETCRTNFSAKKSLIRHPLARCVVNIGHF